MKRVIFDILDLFLKCKICIFMKRGSINLKTSKSKRKLKIQEDKRERLLARLHENRNGYETFRNVIFEFFFFALETFQKRLYIHICN